MPPSKQINTNTLPEYMRRRVSIPGPNTGFLCAYTYYVQQLTAATFVSIRLPFGFRPVAFGYYCRAQAGTTNIFVIRAGTADNNATSGTSITGSPTITNGLDMDVIGNSLVAYRDGNATACILNSTDSDPDVHSTYLTYRLSTADTIDDLCVYVLGYPTTHINTDKAFD